MEGIIKFAENPKDREDFFQFYHEIETLYEIISPDTFLRPYIADYLKLSKIYETIVNAKSMRPIMDLMKKTEELVRKNVTVDGLSGTLKLQKIDENTLEALKKDDASDNSRVINLAKSLVSSIDEDREAMPFLVSIADRAGAIVEALFDRQTTTKEALTSVQKQIEEYLQAKRERSAKNMTPQTFSVYWILKQEGLKNADIVADQVGLLLKHFPNWKVNPNELRDLRAELYKVFIPAVGKERMVELVKYLLKILGGGTTK